MQTQAVIRQATRRDLDAVDKRIVGYEIAARFWPKMGFTPYLRTLFLDL